MLRGYRTITEVTVPLKLLRRRVEVLQVELTNVVSDLIDDLPASHARLQEQVASGKAKLGQRDEHDIERGGRRA